jgi:hypothetical protein
MGSDNKGEVVSKASLPLQVVALVLPRAHSSCLSCRQINMLCQTRTSVLARASAL